MKKQVILISRDNSQVGARIDYELTYVNKIKGLQLFTPYTSPDIFRDFRREFKINILPVVQLEENGIFTTIHMDPDYEGPLHGAGGRQINNFQYVKVNDVEELINKVVELYKK